LKKIQALTVLKGDDKHKNKKKHTSL